MILPSSWHTDHFDPPTCPSVLPSPPPTDYGDHDLVDRNCSCCSSICRCFIGWLTLQNRLHSVVSDFIFELFITFCIILNVITMSIEHHGMSDELAKMLRYANYVCILIGLAALDISFYVIIIVYINLACMWILWLLYLL